MHDYDSVCSAEKRNGQDHTINFDAERERWRQLLASQKYNLIPLIGKNPRETWKEYQTEPIPVEVIRRWRDRRFYASDGHEYVLPAKAADQLNWGLVTGAKPWDQDGFGLVILDADDPEAQTLVEARCPSTPCWQKSGGEGDRKQFVFRHPGFPVRNRQQTHIGGKIYKLDVRGDGGQTVAPGGIHPKTGRPYKANCEWTPELLASCPIYDPMWIVDDRGDKAPDGLGPIEPPPIVEDHNKELPAVAVRVQKYKAHMKTVKGTQQGQGASNRAFAIAVEAVHGFALPENQALAILCEWGERSDQLLIAADAHLVSLSL